MGLVIKENPKKIINKLVSQFSKSSYDERWSVLELDYNGTDLILTGGGAGLLISTRIQTEGEDDPFFLNVDLRRFFEAIKFMGKDIKIIRDEQLVLKKGKKEVKLFIYNREHPLLPCHCSKVPRELMIEKTDRVLRIDERKFEVLKSFIGNESYRPSLTQIAWVYWNEKGYLVSTDGLRLIEYEHETHLDKTILISPDVPLQFDTDIYIQFLQGFIIYHTPDQVIYQNIVENNEYVNYKTILETLKSNYKFAKVNKNDLIFSLQSALSFAGGKDNAGIILSFEDKYMHLCSFNIKGNMPDVFTDKIKIIEGNATESFSFRIAYLLPAVRASDEEDVKLCFADNYHLFIKEPKKMIVVMPRK